MLVYEFTVFLRQPAHLTWPGYNYALNLLLHWFVAVWDKRPPIAERTFIEDSYDE